MSNNNHIVFFSRTLPYHGIGGMEIVLWDLLVEMAKNPSYKVTVITTAIKDQPDKFIAENVTIVAIQNVESRRYTPKWWNLSAEYFEQHLRGETRCVISVAMGACGLLFQRERFKNVPIIWQAHGTVVGEVISKLRTKNPMQILKCLRQIKYFIREYRALKKADKIVVVGKIVERTLKNKPYSYFIRQENICLIENGIAVDNFLPNRKVKKEFRNKFNIPQDAVVVISASRMILQKGVAQGILGFQKFAQEVQNSHMVIVGDGKEAHNLRQLVSKCSLENKITFVGSKNREEIPKYFQMGDIFLFPTLREEGAPLNILEALAAGLSVVCSNYLFESKSISPHIYFASPRDLYDVAEKLLDAYQDSISNEIKLPEKYSISYVANRYLEMVDVY